MQIRTKPGNEGPNLVIDFRPFPIGDCNFRPIVVNIAQDLAKLYIVLDKIGSKKHFPRGMGQMAEKTVQILRSQAMN